MITVGSIDKDGPVLGFWERDGGNNAAGGVSNPPLRVGDNVCDDKRRMAVLGASQ